MSRVRSSPESGIPISSVFFGSIAPVVVFPVETSAVFGNIAQLIVALCTPLPLEAISTSSQAFILESDSARAVSS